VAFLTYDLQGDIQYFGFLLKENKYGIEDWKYLLSRIDKRIHFWCNWWISMGGSLTVIKFVIEAILVYWHLLAMISNGFLMHIQKICFNYLWKGSTKSLGSHLENWKKKIKTKGLRGVGFKRPSLFDQALVAKSLLVF
jgi:hypothetical protein